MQVASADGFRRDPALVHEFYNQRRRDLLKARPNAAHKALVEREKLSPEFSFEHTTLEDVILFLAKEETRR